MIGRVAALILPLAVLSGCKADGFTTISSSVIPSTSLEVATAPSAVTFEGLNWFARTTNSWSPILGDQTARSGLVDSGVGPGLGVTGYPNLAFPGLVPGPGDTVLATLLRPTRGGEAHRYHWSRESYFFACMIEYAEFADASSASGYVDQLVAAIEGLDGTSSDVGAVALWPVTRFDFQDHRSWAVDRLFFPTGPADYAVSWTRFQVSSFGELVVALSCSHELHEVDLGAAPTLTLDPSAISTRYTAEQFDFSITSFADYFDLQLLYR